MGQPCPQLDALGALLEEPEDAAATRAVAGHVESCPSCQQRLSELAGGSGWLEPLREAAIALSANSDPQLDALMDALSSSGVGSFPGNEPSERADFDVDACLDPSEAPGSIGRFERYEVTHVLGRGGMGVVLDAYDAALHRPIAIKLLSPGLASSPSARARFEREAGAAARVEHENVVRIYGVGHARGLPFIVMQRVNGRSLAARLAEPAPVPLEQAVRIGAEVARGLAAAHAHGVVHRDVKPANILLDDATGRAMLADFGVARAADDATVTLAGHIAGTPQYMSPEQARGEPTDHRADLFALGCVLYEMCAGAAPFAGGSPLAVMQRVCDEQAAPLAQLDPSLPPGLVGLIERLLQKDVALRCASADAVAHELELLQGVPRGPGHARPKVRRLSRSRRVAVTVLVLLLGSSIAIVAVRDRSDSPSRAIVPTATPAADLPFVVLAPGAEAQPATFASLAQAVVAAPAGSAIEIRSGATFELSQPLTISRSLTLRAGKGYTPIFASADEPLLLVGDADLVLEGITFQSSGWDVDGARAGGRPYMIDARGARFAAANCRFTLAAKSAMPSRAAIIRVAGAECDIRNCEFYGELPAVTMTGPRGHRRTLRAENCGFATSCAVTAAIARGVQLRVELTRNTLACLRQAIVVAGGDEAAVQIESRHNVIRADALLAGSQVDLSLIPWRDEHSVLELGSPTARSGEEGIQPIPGDREAQFVQAAVRFAVDQPGVSAPASAEQFRIISVIAANGEPLPSAALAELGADVGQLGPGAPYEAWKRTADYHQWLEAATTPRPPRQPS